VNPLIIRADATSESGTGHVIRCLALAQVWRAQGGKVVFISHCESEALRQRIRAEGIDLHALVKSYPDSFDWNFTQDILDQIKSGAPKSHPWLTVDGYHFDAAYQEGVKGAGYNLLWIDDYGQAEHYYADLVLNQNISAAASWYAHREPYTRLLMGPRYALLRREFERWQGWQRQIPARAGKVLVTLGGADQNNVTLKVIQALSRVNIPDLKARIVVGPANPHLASVKKAIANDARLHLFTNLDDMSSLMAWADISISAGGSTCWELAFMGLPFLIIVTANNQRANAEALARQGIGLNLGWQQDLSVEKVSSQVRSLMIDSGWRSLMARKGKQLVDGHGGWRLRNLMAGERLKLCPILSEDIHLVWKWANDDSVRAASFSEAQINWEEHIRWFQERIKRPYFYLALNQDDLPVGQVRFDQNETGMTISVMIDSAWRNRGYGVTLIRTACEEVFANSDVKMIHAFVKPDNEASRIAFIRAGFEQIGDNMRNGCQSCHYILIK
jgi:UDP-2,4-diacetamido-2,4,6-trideoxy-beta-L-altropyranose hydrolase